MSLTIWKFDLRDVDVQAVSMPAGASLLSVQTQDGIPRVWALVDPSQPEEHRVFVTYGTGHVIDDAPSDLRYVGTYQLHDGSLVFHVFEIIDLEGDA